MISLGGWLDGNLVQHLEVEVVYHQDEARKKMMAERKKKMLELKQKKADEGGAENKNDELFVVI